MADYFDSAATTGTTSRSSVALDQTPASSAGERASGQPRAAAPDAPPPPLQVVQAPGWQRFDWLQHGFSTRAGGVSSVYGERTLNLGWTGEDDPANVVQNRHLFASAVAQAPDIHTAPAVVSLRQVHSALLHVIERDAGGTLRAEGSPARVTDEDHKPLLTGDGLMTGLPGVMLAVGVADCVPVLLADVNRRVVAAFHAGWRGTLARIVEGGVERMRLRYGSRPEDLIAVIGPSIGRCCYTVGDELRSRFHSQFAYASDLFSPREDTTPARATSQSIAPPALASGHATPEPPIHLDLWEANRRQLVDVGVNPAQITVIGECTACTRSGDARKYFSHRADHGVAGRGLGMIGIKAG